MAIAGYQTTELTLQVNQGDDFSLTVKAWADAAKTTPLDLSGYSARMQARHGYDAGSPVLSLTTGGGGITITGPSGEVAIAITNAQSAALPAGKLVYDVELVSGAGAVTKLIRGTMVVVPEVTR